MICIKRWISYLLAISSLLCLCACQEYPAATGPSKPEEHVHILSQSVILQALSCSQDQINIQYCNCGYSQATLVQEAVGHDVENGACVQCKRAVSEDLEFSLNADGASYSVAGIGKFRGTDLIIPDTYEGKPVTAIRYKAFYGQDQITGITIPDSVTAIGYSAFYGCTNLCNVTLPDNITVIENYAFFGCSHLVHLSMGSNVEKIGSFSLGNCTLLNLITFHGTTAQWEAIPKIYGWNSQMPACTARCADGVLALS